MAYAGDLKTGALVLYGDVLRYNQYAAWKKIFELAGGDLANIVVIASAHDRAKLYGEFAVRALSRYGPLVKLLPLSISTDDFNNDYRKLAHDPQIIQQVRAADAIFFVGGAPQRLATVLLEEDHALTPLAEAIRSVYIAGGVIVGGIPGQVGVNTDIDTMGALEQGQIAQDDLFQGLNLIAQGWFVDQHFLSPGRFVQTLLAMLQNGKNRGIGIHADTLIIYRDNQFQVIGETGAVIIDLSDAVTTQNDFGIDIQGVRLTYLTDGDRFDLSTLYATVHPATLEGFEIDPNTDNRQPMLANQSAASNILTQHGLTDLMSIALDSEDKQVIGFAFLEKAEQNNRGFKFRFYTGKDSRGWLTTRFKEEKYVAHNILLDVTPTTREEAANLAQ